MKNKNIDKTLLNYIKAQPNKEQPQPMATDNWYPKISTRSKSFTVYWLQFHVLVAVARVL